MSIRAIAKVVPMESVTGKHPNMNVETQIPLEL